MPTSPSQLTNSVNFSTAALTSLVVGCDNTTSSQSQKFTLDALRTKILEGITWSTNLTATHSPTNVVVASDTGTDATIVAATGTNCGLMTPAQFTKLSLVTVATTAVDLNALATASHAAVTLSDTSMAQVGQALSVRVSSSPGNQITVLSDGIFTPSPTNRTLGEDDLGNVAGAVTVDVNAGTSRNKRLNLTANVTLSIATGGTRGPFHLVINSNGFTVTYSTNIIRPSGDPTLTSGVFVAVPCYYAGA